VIDAVGTPLLPTHPARARKLLNSQKAKVVQVVPYTIQLMREVPNPVGGFVIGVDDGAKVVGVAIKNEKTEEIIFRGEIKLRQDVSRKVAQRSDYRRSRRSKNLRYRPPRWSNRIKSKLPPSIRCRKDSILRFTKDMQKRLFISKVIVEEVSFNHFKYKYGKFFSLTEIGKKYLKEQLQFLGLIYQATFGYVTKPARLTLGLSKTHSNDAIAICNPGSIKIASLDYQIKPRRTRVWDANPTKKSTEKKGFRHYDLIKASHRTRGYVIGSIRSLKAKVITLRTKFDNDFSVSYNKSRILQRPDGLVYSY